MYSHKLCLHGEAALIEVIEESTSSQFETGDGLKKKKFVVFAAAKDSDAHGCVGMEVILWPGQYEEIEYNGKRYIPIKNDDIVASIREAEKVA